MSKNQIPKWTPEREEELKDIVGREKPVSANTVRTAASRLETTVGSIAAKLRKMNFEVASLAEKVEKKYTEEQEKEIVSFLGRNEGKYTYAEIAEKVLGGKYTAREIQGKILSMDLYGKVKKTPKVEVEKKYSDDEEAKLLSLIKEGKFMEDIAEVMNKPMNSVRGKILSMLTKYEGLKVPKQRNYKAVEKEDTLSTLENIDTMTVAEIAEVIEKSERSVKVMLTHRGISCKNYDGKGKAEKIAKKKLAEAEEAA